VPSHIDDLIARYPKVGAAIQWQATPASATNVYLPPPAKSKVAYSSWTAKQKADLQSAFVDACKWFGKGAPQARMSLRGLTDQPVNTDPNTASNATTVLQSVTPAYMWKLYIGHVGFSLAAQYGRRFPWSIGSYSDEALRYLLDSTTMAWNISGTRYAMGTYAARVPARRADNLPKTAFAPPKWTYPFLQQAGLVGATKIDTICRVLEWMRQHMAHYQQGPNGQGGDHTFASFIAAWQYRGYPPLSRIVAGTVDANNPNEGVQHWTAGCHGSVGFLCAVLRAANIPVQPVWVCGHALACFPTEKMYLDHGDDPYNQNVKSSSQPISQVLIDERTYRSRFSHDLLVNITAPSPACPSVGLAAVNFPP
jgi:hypothetical protein